MAMVRGIWSRSTDRQTEIPLQMLREEEQKTSEEQALTWAAGVRLR